MPKVNKEAFDNAILDRELTLTGDIIVREDGDKDSRIVELSFSSDNDQLERWGDIEVLVHGEENVRLDRLNNGGAVLVDHDTTDQVGVVLKAWLDGGKGRAEVRFSRSARGDEVYNDVVDKIRQLVSVRYKVHAYEVDRKAGEPDVIRITDWEPVEISFVAVPFDPSVGVGRSQPSTKQEEITMPKEVGTTPEQPKPAEPTRAAPEAPDIGTIQQNTLREERERADSIRKIADDHQVTELGARAISEGWPVSKFNEEALKAVGERNNKARSESDHDGEVPLSEREEKRYDLMALMRHLAEPENRYYRERAAFELEVSDAAVKDFGPNFNARGVYVPETLLTRRGQSLVPGAEGQRALTAGTATEAAELIATNLLAGSFIDVLRNASTMVQAGATMLPGLVGNVDIPRQTGGSTAAWLSAEDADASESEPAFDQVPMTPKDLAVYTEFTRRALQQSTPAIDGLVRADMAMAIALAWDLATLYGSGASGQPTGVINQVGVNSVTFAAAGPTYVELIEMVGAILADNALTGVPSWIIDAAGWEHLSTTPKQASGVEGNFIMPDDRIKGYGSRVSNQLTTGDYWFGDWSQVLIGEWGGLELNVDPYTHSLKGRTRFVAFKTTDIAVRRPDHFCIGNDDT